MPHAVNQAEDRALVRLPLLPYAEQCALIEEHIARDRDVAALIHALARLRDHQPLSHALVKLARAGMLDRADIALALDEVFTSLPDTGIQRVLHASAELSGQELGILTRCVKRAVETLPLGRLAVICLMDRWLKNHAPLVRAELVARAEDEVRRLLGAGRLGDIADESLLRLPGERILAVDQDFGQDRPRFQARLEEFAGRVLDVLEGVPKSLSQANAEEILAHRVYTDPGHFLVELLQNAEDARARTFRVHISQAAVTVWHDGVPFDAKDVVGVLSIGQTTKQKDQIGFFGVGFKSVYEITERPQVYSGPFCFEIADVSIPRRLERPADHEAGTLLVLRSRKSPADDPLRSPEALFERALAVPPETLLTLASLRRMDVALGERYRRVHAEAEPASSRVRLSMEREGEREGERARHARIEYLVETDRFVCDSVMRESGRASETPILVGVALDAAGVPVPLDRDAPTIFSYLPTRERSGLRFLLHAHFDVPVDRERLDLDSAWNRWAMARAGELLARAVRRLVAESHAALPPGPGDGPGDRPEGRILDGILDVLPLAAELAHPAYGALLHTLSRDLAGVAFLPGADGRRLAPDRAAMAGSPALARALAGVDLSGAGLDGTGRQMLAPMTSTEAHRREQVALALGARRFLVEDLVALLERALAGVADGSEFPRPWLGRGHAAILDMLASAVLPPDLEARLAALPLLCDQSGRLYRAASLGRADPALREVYGDARPLLDAHLDRDADRAHAALLARLGVRTLGPADLIADLAVPELAMTIAGHGKAARVIEYLARAPLALTAPVGKLAMFPELGTDRLLPLVGPAGDDHARAWLTDASPLAAFLAGMEGTRPPLVDPAVSTAYGDFLRALGGRTLDLAEILAGIAETGRIVMSERDLALFHDTVDAMRPDLTPRLCDKLARSPVFRDRTGMRRPLVGPTAALVPTQPDDHEIAALSPDAPWLDSVLSRLPYVRTLGIATMGPAEIAAELAGQHTGRPHALDLDQNGVLRRVYAYLARHHADIPAATLTALARARVWLDTHGQRHALADLRRPPMHASLAALYRAWNRFALIEDESVAGHDAPHATSAFALACALGLSSHITTPDHDTLIRDVVMFAGLDAPIFGRIRAGLALALNEAAAELPRSHVRLLEAAPLFRAARTQAHAGQATASATPGTSIQAGTGGEVGQAGEALYPLVSWSAPLSTRGVARAQEPLSSALAMGSRPILEPEDENLFFPLIQTLGMATATVDDLIRAALHDPAFAAAPSRHAARRALVALLGQPGAERRAGHKALPGARAELSAPGREALPSLPIWPTTDGRLLAASSVVRMRDLDRLVTGFAHLGQGADSWQEALGAARTEIGILDPLAEADAWALEHLIGFRDPGAMLTAVIEDIAVPGEPLSAQPALLGQPERVAELFCMAMEHGDAWSLPLVVDARGRLVRGRRYLASDDELVISRHLPLMEQLAHPAWASALGERGRAALTPISLRQVIAAIAQATPEAVSLCPGHEREDQYLHGPAQRQRLHAWLVQHGEAIAGDAQARGALGRACIIATQGGYLRAPRDLLFDADLPDLGIDWNAADEVPDALCRWLRQTFAPDEARLAPLVEHLLAAHERDVREGEHTERGERSHEILIVLARVLRVGVAGHDQALALVQRFKLRRRLRVEDSTNEFTRPRALLAPSEEHWRLIVRFAVAPPPRVSSRYASAAVRELICLAGASAELGSEQLGRLLTGEGRRHGFDAYLALACYVAELAHRTPALRSALALDRRAWIPSRAGMLRRPDELYWPDTDVALVVGDDPALFPHPAFFHAVPAEIGSWLRFRRAEDAALGDVAAHIERLVQGGAVVPDEILDWLEQGLRQGLLDSADIFVALGHVRFLVDDSGAFRCAAEVVREGAAELFGRRLGTWSAGAMYPRLSSALKIARRPGKREVLAYCEEIARELAGDDEKLTGQRTRDLARELAMKLDGHFEHGSAHDLLAREPELLDTLPRCLAVLAAARGSLPARLPIAIEDTRGRTSICLAPWPGVLHRSTPHELVRAAVDAAAPLAFAWLPADLQHEHAGPAEIDALLARLGVEDLTAVPETLLPAVRPWKAMDRDRHDTEARTPRPLPSPSNTPDREQARPETTKERTPRRDERARASELVSSKDDASGHDEPRQAPERPEQESPDDHDRRGLFTRIRRWLAPDEQRDPDADEHTPRPEPASQPRKQKAEERASSPPSRRADAGNNAGSSRRTPPGSTHEHDDTHDGPRDPDVRPDQSQWFRPRHRMGPQLGDNTAWAQDRRHAPSFGMAFAPHSLPAPYLYAPKVIFDRFEPGAQRWVHTELPAEWAAPLGPGSYEVELRGRVPAGEVVLPVPAYGRVSDISATPRGQLIGGHPGSQIFFSESTSDIHYTVILDRAPEFEATGTDDPGALARARHLRAPTVPDDELPAEVHAALDRIQDQHGRALDRALAVRDFIRERYYYDPAYIEDPTVGRWLRNVSRGRANAHLAAMHAGRDAHYLGRGVCYELNTLACELLRRAGVPAAVAVGWTLDRGHIDEPDHLWAMALLPTNHGLRWLPLDASTTQHGQPLHAGRRPPGPWRAETRRQSAPPPRSPAWARGTERRHEQGPALPVSELVRVVRYIETLTGETLRDMNELRQRCRELLSDPGAASALLQAVLDIEDPRDEQG